MTRLRFFLSFLWTLAAAGNLAAQHAGAVPGELLLEMAEGRTPDQALENSHQFFFAAEKLTPAFDIWLVKYDTSKWDYEKLTTRFRESRIVKNIQPNHYIQQRGTIPDDSLFPAQWNLINLGVLPNSIPGADINAPDAWDMATGGVTVLGDTIVVAVIDGGFDLTHSDLDFWKNRNEIPGNKIDDDANGYIDDYDGWNVFTDSGRIEVDVHGTHVAGIAGARGNNRTGISGVNWNVKLMPVEGASELESYVIKAYGYVYTMRRLYNLTNGLRGAFIVASNSSFGVNNGRPHQFPIWCGLYDKMGQEGILNAVATANNGNNVELEGDIPSLCPSDYTIVVTNTNSRDEKSGGAAYGKTSVDIGAPGSEILSTMPENSYGIISGTSMATPHVSGSVALLYSAPCPRLAYMARTRPGEAVLYVKNLLTEWVDPLKGFDTLVSSGGRLNIANSIRQLQRSECIIPTYRSMDITRIFPNPGKGKIRIRYTKYEETDADLLIYTVHGQLLYRTHTFTQPAGQYAIDLNTASFAPGTYIVVLRSSTVQSNIIKLVLF